MVSGQKNNTLNWFETRSSLSHCTQIRFEYISLNTVFGVTFWSVQTMSFEWRAKPLAIEMLVISMDKLFAGNWVITGLSNRGFIWIIAYINSGFCIITGLAYEKLIIGTGQMFCVRVVFRDMNTYPSWLVPFDWCRQLWRRRKLKVKRRHAYKSLKTAMVTK